MMKLSRFITSKQPKQFSAFIAQLQKTIKGNEQFVSIVEDWKNLQIRHIGSLMQLQTKIRDKIQQSQLQAYTQFLQMLETIVKSHKSVITKLNQQIVQTCYPVFEKIIEKQKQLLCQQKLHNKDIVNRKQQISKLVDQQEKLKKPLYQDLVQQIFSHNSVKEPQNKQKIVKRAEEMYEKKDKHCEKIRETRQLYCNQIKKTKQNLRRFDNYQNSFVSQAFEAIKKARNGITLFSQSLSTEIQSNKTQSTKAPSQNESKLNFFQLEVEEILRQTQIGYLQTTIQLIRSRMLQQIIQHTRDKNIKKKIKSVIDSTQTSPQFTDEVTRQVQLVKRIVKSKQLSLLENFKIIMTKSWKYRLNFIFMLQLYRINNQFQITESQIEAIVILINQLLKICQKYKDAFIIKHTIILLLTYYITVRTDESDHKIYILQFFKKNRLWKNFQLWESMLIQTIYVQKKATLRMLLKTSQIKNNEQLLEAEKSLILNQMLYVVKNMILFDFNEKEVKQFANKFVKILKLDQNFLRDVYKTIETAIEEQKGNVHLKDLNLQNHQLYNMITENDQQFQ